MADNGNDSRRSLVPGLALLGLLLVAILSIVAACWCLLAERPLEAGACLVPAAIAFGVVAHVSYR
ncbi:MAG: hypothetical protein WBF17_10090 [Phycisphaerae bacterium]